MFRTRSKHTEFLADIFEDEKAGQKKTQHDLVLSQCWSLVNPFHPKPSVMVPQDQTPSSSSLGGGSVLENDNYHQFVRQSEAVFSLGEDSEASSSSSSTPSPRDPSEQASDHPPDVRRSGPGAILDRLKSGVVTTGI